MPKERRVKNPRLPRGTTKRQTRQQSKSPAAAQHQREEQKASSRVGLISNGHVKAREGADSVCPTKNKRQSEQEASSEAAEVTRDQTRSSLPATLQTDASTSSEARIHSGNVITGLQGTASVGLSPSNSNECSPPLARAVAPEQNSLLANVGDDSSSELRESSEVEGLQSQQDALHPSPVMKQVNGFSRETKGGIASNLDKGKGRLVSPLQAVDGNSNKSPAQDVASPQSSHVKPQSERQAPCRFCQGEEQEKAVNDKRSRGTRKRKRGIPYLDSQRKKGTSNAAQGYDSSAGTSEIGCHRGKRLSGPVAPSNGVRSPKRADQTPARQRASGPDKESTDILVAETPYASMPLSSPRHAPNETMRTDMRDASFYSEIPSTPVKLIPIVREQVQLNKTAMASRSVADRSHLAVPREEEQGGNTSESVDGVSQLVSAKPVRNGTQGPRGRTVVYFLAQETPESDVEPSAQAEAAQDVDVARRGLMAVEGAFGKGTGWRQLKDQDWQNGRGTPNLSLHDKWADSRSEDTKGDMQTNAQGLEAIPETPDTSQAGSPPRRLSEDGKDPLSVALPPTTPTANFGVESPTKRRRTSEDQSSEHLTSASGEVFLPESLKVDRISLQIKLQSLNPAFEVETIISKLAEHPGDEVTEPLICCLSIPVVAAKTGPPDAPAPPFYSWTVGRLEKFYRILEDVSMEDQATLTGFDTIVYSRGSYAHMNSARIDDQPQSSEVVGAIRVYFMSSTRDETRKQICRLLRHCEIIQKATTTEQLQLHTEMCELAV